MGVCCQLESSKNLKVIISEHKNVNTVHSASPSQKITLAWQCTALEGEALLHWSVVFFFLSFFLSLSLSLSLFFFNCIPLLERVEMLPGPAAGSWEGSGGFSPSKPLRDGLAVALSRPGLSPGEEKGTGVVTVRARKRPWDSLLAPQRPSPPPF